MGRLKACTTIHGIEDPGMKFMYAILAVAGWAWLVIAALLLWWRISLLKRSNRSRGFDVVASNK
jgi:hypothetical protein